MKRTLAILLALTMLMTVTACGNDTPKPNETPATTTVGDTTVGGETTTVTDADAADTTTSATNGTASTDGTTEAKPTSATKSDTEEGQSIRILAVGDGFAIDAVQSHLYGILKAAGYQTVELGILYADKSTIDTHYNNVKSDKAVYDFHRTTDGKWKKESKTAPSKALKAADWDAVVLQQSAADSGMPATYSKLGDLLSLIKKQCDADVYWHMTWAYRRSSGAAGFDNYKYSESSMYEAIVNTALKQVMRQADIWGLIPTATTIQNLRTSTLRSELTKDGVRLTDYGSYAAALTWYCLLTGESAKDVTYRPNAVKEHFDVLAEAADNAVSIPNKVTSTTAGDGALKDLRILSIGHSFSVDAMRTYMWDLFEAAGYNVTIGYLYYPSCSLEQHWHYISNNSKSYEQYAKNSDGKWVNQSTVDAKTALWDEDWDIVTFQPDPDFGYDTFANGVPCRCEWGCNTNISSDYLHFNDLVDKVLAILADPNNPNGPNTDVKLYYHLTWTFAADCWLGKYLYPKGYNQMTLYQDFINATKNKVLTNKNILGVIPCNTAIENARTSFMGDTFNAEAANDGYHLNDKGDLVAALTWVSYFTGTDASQIYCDSPYNDREYAAIAEAVDNAIKTPWSVTESTYKTEE